MVVHWSTLYFLKCGYTITTNRLVVVYPGHWPSTCGVNYLGLWIKLALCTVKIRPPFLNKQAFIGSVYESEYVRVCVCVCPGQQVSWKNGAVVKHRRIFAVYRTTSNVKGFFKEQCYATLPLCNDFPRTIRVCSYIHSVSVFTCTYITIFVCSLCACYMLTSLFTYLLANALDNGCPLPWDYLFFYLKIETL